MDQIELSRDSFVKNMAGELASRNVCAQPVVNAVEVETLEIIRKIVQRESASPWENNQVTERTDRDHRNSIFPKRI